MSIVNTLANELNVSASQVDSAVALLDGGATVPFIARYRKEVTGALDDIQLRQLEERLGYLRELADRKLAVIKSIDEQGKLTGLLKSAIEKADTKTAVEDLYLPYKKKRKTKGQIAIAAGLEPLADSLFQNREQDPEATAQSFVDADKGINDVKAALDGAKFILMERFAEDAGLLAKLRVNLVRDGALICQLLPGSEEKGAKFQDYFDYTEAYSKVPSHRALAVFRGRNEGILSISIDLPLEEKPKVHPFEMIIREHIVFKEQGLAADKWLTDVVRWTWRVKLQSYIETDLLSDLRLRAEQAAIKVFAENLKDLLLAAPGGPKVTLALDPGLRTGCKVAVVDATGKLLEYATIYPHQPRNEYAKSAAVIKQLAEKFTVELVAIGNGTASRETDKLVADVIKHCPELRLKKVMVSEAGASVYSASELASKEFPDLDVTIRGAVSIARRLQDPLGELVKIEPKAIGVGQYQHDVSQLMLSKALDSVVEDCVNAVGVDVNMASAELLGHVSGLNATIAKNIVAFRDEKGAFKNRDVIKQVPRFGDKTFEQAAGFLRIRHGDNPLDGSSVHPESYALVEQIAEKAGVDIQAMIGAVKLLDGISIDQFVSESVGKLTLTDIVDELKKPGRDPRPEFKTADFKEGVENLKDLKPAMILQGTVTNVTAFGAFVDVGVHQDGLVHISALSESFVKDPRDVVKTGDIVKVKVMEVDIPRKRIGLSMRMSDEPEEGKRTQTHTASPKKSHKQSNRQNQASPAASNAFAQAFAQAKQKK